jgi:FkbM family methyltransferase
MGIKRAIKNSIKRLLAARGYALVSANEARATTECVFQRIVKRNHPLKTVIDIGASDGRWSSSLMRYFPLCQYLLIEAQPVHETALRQFCSARQNTQCVLAAAGETLGQINFDTADPFGGQASHTPYAAHNITVPMTSIDHEIESRQLEGPYLMKLDTHGYEVPILKGARQTLLATEVIVMECYNFRIAPECLLFYEMCEHLKGLGFRCIDMIGPLFRVHDDVLWQMDLVFVKDSRAEFSYLAYK